jgi:hypothetical protein
LKENPAKNIKCGFDRQMIAVVAAGGRLAAMVINNF